MLSERGRGVGDRARCRRTHLVRCRRRLETRLRGHCACAGFEFVEDFLNVSQTLLDQIDLAFTFDSLGGFTGHERTSGKGSILLTRNQHPLTLLARLSTRTSGATDNV